MNTSLVEISAAEQKLAARVDPSVISQLQVSGAVGGLGFRNAAEAMEFAKLMAISHVAVPKHLRGNPGACLAVTIQAVEWQMSPYAVANKSYSVNDRLAYESQLVQAVILKRAPIKGRLKVEYIGDGDKRVCKVWATLTDGETVEYQSPEFGKIQPKNSPLWKSDPDQQQFYYAGRALCRRHFPDVLLGVYDRDEIDDAPRDPAKARDVTPAPRSLSERLDALANAAQTEPHDPAPDTGDVSEDVTTEQQEQIETGSEPCTPAAAEQGADDPPAVQGEPAAKTLADYDTELAMAAKSGTEALQTAWAAVPAGMKPSLKAALDRRHKQTAATADAASAGAAKDAQR